MPALRCTGCNANFPAEPTPNQVAELGFPNDHGDECPICELWECEGLRNALPDSEEDLRQRVTHARFERYLENETDEQRVNRQLRYGAQQREKRGS